jgi:hypothetical protein
MQNTDWLSEKDCRMQWFSLAQGAGERFRRGM